MAQKQTTKTPSKAVDISVIVLSVLGSAKLILEAFGISGIQDADLNSVANGVAGLFTIVGAVKGSRKVKGK